MRHAVDPDRVGGFGLGKPFLREPLAHDVGRALSVGPVLVSVDAVAAPHDQFRRAAGQLGHVEHLAAVEEHLAVGDWLGQLERELQRRKGTVRDQRGVSPVVVVHVGLGHEKPARPGQSAEARRPSGDPLERSDPGRGEAVARQGLTGAPAEDRIEQT